jgi:hypothetical protein
MALHYKLNEVEETTLEKWVNSRKVKTALYKGGGKLTLTFSESGIGLHIQANVMKDGVSLMTHDVTDYESW